MQEQDKAKFSEIMARLGEVYEKSITPSYLELFWRLLKEFDIFVVEEAVELHLRNPDNGQYPPKPADLIRAIEGDSDTRACEAWCVLQRGIRTTGRYAKAPFSDPLLPLVIERMGGWSRLCQSTQAELSRREREFVTLYKATLRYQAKHVQVEKSQPEYGSLSHGTDETLRMLLRNGASAVMDEKVWSALALTKMEVEVLRKAKEDFPIKAMAKSLSVSPETIKWHRKNILVKMRCHTITKAVIEAYKAGIL